MNARTRLRGCPVEERRRRGLISGASLRARSEGQGAHADQGECSDADGAWGGGGGGWHLEVAAGHAVWRGVHAAHGLGGQS